MKTSSEHQKQPDPKVAFMGVTYTCPDLTDPAFVSQFGQHPHERVVVDVNVVEDDRVVDLAGFPDELFDHDLFLLVLSVLHS